MTLPIAENVSDLVAAQDAARMSFHVERIKIADAVDWSMVDGAFQHRSQGFFSVVGVASADAGADTERVLLYQPQAAVTGLLYAMVDGQMVFLIQARAEPGCVGEVQFGPTVQSTPANYMRLHGGKSSPYAHVFVGFDPRVRLVGDTTQSDLGERYLMKCKRQTIAEYQGALMPEAGFLWASAACVRHALGRSTLLNIDLRSLLALVPWSSDGVAGELVPASAEVRKSLQRPVRANVMGAIYGGTTVPRARALQFKPLDALQTWHASEWGLRETVPRQGFSVDFYRVKAALREVSQWSQPLVTTQGTGYCGLACRRGEEGLEVGVRLLSEYGLALGYGLAPTVLEYPGATVDQGTRRRAHTKSLVATVESDEGGRFFKNQSLYELYLDDDLKSGDRDDLVWINVAELKLLLNTSNLCTIQLRGLASHLLDVEI